MTCPRCGTTMQGGVCPECGFPAVRYYKKRLHSSFPFLLVSNC